MVQKDKLSVKAVAEYLNCDLRMAYRKIKQGDLEILSYNPLHISLTSVKEHLLHKYPKLLELFPKPSEVANGS